MDYPQALFTFIDLCGALSWLKEPKLWLPLWRVSQPWLPTYVALSKLFDKHNKSQLSLQRHNADQAQATRLFSRLKLKTLFVI
jgi:hypothetical protein